MVIAARAVSGRISDRRNREVKVVRFGRLLDDGGESDMCETIADPNSPDVVEGLVRSDLIDKVRAAVASLPDEARQAIRRKFWGEYSLDRDDAQALGGALRSLANILPATATR